jgi:hypothetical protein
MKRPTWGVAVALALLWHGNSAPASQAPATRTPVDRGVRSALRASAVPVLLPSKLPRALGGIRSLAVISADRAGYYVGYSPLEHCAGGLRCALFHVAGFAKSGRLEHRKHDRPLRLFDGTPALFRPKDCSGAACTEASLFFTRRGVLYELDANVAAHGLAVLTDAYRALRIVR